MNWKVGSKRCKLVLWHRGNSLIACNTAPQNPKWAQGDPKITDGVRKGVFPLDFGRFRQLLLNTFFDTITPSMEKVDDGEKKEKKKRENNDVYSGH